MGNPSSASPPGKVSPKEITSVMLTGFSSDYIFRVENWWQSDAWPVKGAVCSLSQTLRLFQKTNATWLPQGPLSHFSSQLSPQPTLLRCSGFITLIKADVQTVLQTDLATIFISPKSVSAFKKNMSAVNGHNFVYWFRQEVLLLRIKPALSRLIRNYSERRVSG